ncbi:hypothetical protein IEG05_00330 [Pseudomonas kunmingensis]|uniref:hypothetical protein n=1 Tax=Stutzerimonas kunmingensis TaxID=1211807 RepID=UPI0005B348B4|nr:hypothetical protein [Stutzerimonas kunmingensis]MBD3873684.1 hypothetical protein [Stutzerimonas kunmingensis]
MRFFALAQDVALDTNRIHRMYWGVDNPHALTLERLYLDVGVEVQLVANQLKQLPETALQAQPDETAQADSDLLPLGLNLVNEDALLGWPHFPARLGRISSRPAEGGLRFHLEDQPLPAQLLALRARKFDKHHWRFAVVNGFGAALGDCTIGITAFRVVLRCLQRHFPSLSRDILLGPGSSAATADILGHAPGVERVLFQPLTAAEFAQYDGYFDFSNLTSRPGFSEMPIVDWVLWWCGLAPQDVPPTQKRNQGHIHQDAWQAVQVLLRQRSGKKVLFNPKASVALRSMPEDVARRFVQRLLELSPDIQWVIDQPLAFKHKRLTDLSGKITTPEMFKALVGHMDGVITVDTFALHQADISATPCVTLCSSIAPSFYPYYPHNTAIGIPGYDTLPAYRRPKVNDSEWEAYKSAYHAAWASLDPVEVLNLLRTKIDEKMADALAPKAAQPQAHPQASPSLTIGSPLPPASCEVQQGRVPRLKRQRLAPEHAWASQRFAVLTEQLVQPGSIAVMACAPDASLVLTLAERIAPHGELIVLEARAPLARNVETALHLAGSPCAARVLQAVSLGGAQHANINVLQPWSESHSTEWGNLPAVTTVPSQPLDSLALAHCNALLVQAPMHFELFVHGALETLQRCRPFVLMTPVSREEATAVLQAAQAAHYDFWVEAALPDTEPATAASASAWLLVGVPRERPVRVSGFTPLSLE